MNKYLILSGWRRGGTSAIMGALRQAGIPVIGYRFPITLRNPNTKQVEKTDVGTFDVSARVAKDNPRGYWEFPTITLREGIRERWNNLGVGGELIKIPFETLTLSDPRMIEKTVIILRDPLSVIESRIKAPVPTENKTKRSKRITSLVMLYNAILSLRWLNKYKIPYYVIGYENLLKNPEKELGGVCKFLNRGDPKWGARDIEKKLNTSKPIENNYEETQMVKDFYNDILFNHRFEAYDLDKLLERINKLDKQKQVKYVVE